jgi:hypothetical protein
MFLPDSYRMSSAFLLLFLTQHRSSRANCAIKDDAWTVGCFMPCDTLERLREDEIEPLAI